jgi:hypothetical protein
METNRKRVSGKIAGLAAAALLVGGATLATTASARDSFSISIGGPGYAVGYSNRGYAPAYRAGYYPAPVYAAPAYAPPVVYSPAPVYSYYGYTAPYYAPVVVSRPVVYRAPYVSFGFGRSYYRGDRRHYGHR